MLPKVEIPKNQSHNVVGQIRPKLFMKNFKAPSNVHKLAEKITTKSVIVEVEIIVAIDFKQNHLLTKS